MYLNIRDTSPQTVLLKLLDFNSPCIEIVIVSGSVQTDVAVSSILSDYSGLMLKQTVTVAPSWTFHIGSH